MRTAWGRLLFLALGACGPILGVESIHVDDVPNDTTDSGTGGDGGTSKKDSGPSAGCVVGTTRSCDEHPGLDGIGTCKAGTQTCVGADDRWSECVGSVGPTEEQCDYLDRNCNNVSGNFERADPSPPGTMNCTRIWKCPGTKRGAIYYRSGLGFTNVAGPDTLWTAYADRGDFSDMTFPPNTFRISRDETGNKLGPVPPAVSDCCPEGCPTANTLFDGNGQYYTERP